MRYKKQLDKTDFEAMQRQHMIMQGLNDNFQREKITACDNKYKYFEMGLISTREKTFINMVAKHSAFDKLRLQGTISPDFDWVISSLLRKWIFSAVLPPGYARERHGFLKEVLASRSRQVHSP